MASTASLSPFTTFSTPSGSPASFASSASLSGQDGSFSEGFRTKVFPQAMAIGNIHIGTIAGKLNGVIPAHTPRGWRTVQASIPLPTCSVYSPFRRCGIPQANSTTSRPRTREPWESVTTFPCSAVISAASSSACSSISDLYLNIILARTSGGVAAQAGNASRALATAASTSAEEASGTRLDTAPVAGLYTSPKRSEFPARRSPLIQWYSSMTSSPRSTARIRPASRTRCQTAEFRHHPRVSVREVSGPRGPG